MVALTSDGLAVTPITSANSLPVLSNQQILCTGQVIAKAGNGMCAIWPNLQFVISVIGTSTAAIVVPASFNTAPQSPAAGNHYGSDAANLMLQVTTGTNCLSVVGTGTTAHTYHWLCELNCVEVG